MFSMLEEKKEIFLKKNPKTWFTSNKKKKK